MNEGYLIVTDDGDYYFLDTVDGGDYFICQPKEKAKRVTVQTTLI